MNLMLDGCVSSVMMLRLGNNLDRAERRRAELKQTDGRPGASEPSG